MSLEQLKLLIKLTKFLVKMDKAIKLNNLKRCGFL